MQLYLKLYPYIISACLLTIVYSCTSKKQDSFSDVISRTQIKVDSACHYYDLAKQDLLNNKPIPLIIQTYKPFISSLHESVSKILDSVTDEYMKRQIPQSKYDLFLKSIHIDSVIDRSNRLKEQGIDFLKNQ